jgi:hypothetical protein
MEYQVELTYILKRAIQCLYKDLISEEEVALFYISDNDIPSPPREKRKKGKSTYLDEIQYAEFTLRQIHDEDKVESGIAAIHDA